MNTPRTDAHEINLAQFRAVADVLRARIKSPRTGPDCQPSPRTSIKPDPLDLPALLSDLARRFTLTPFEAEVLALAVAVELDPALARAVRKLQPNREARPTFASAFSLLTAPHWTVLSPERPLLRWQLLRTGNAPILADVPFSIDPRILHALLGVGSDDPMLELYARRCGTARPLAPSQRLAAKELGHVLETDPACLTGGDANDRETIVLAAAGPRPVWAFGNDVPGDPVERQRLARVIERECVLTGMVPLIEHDAGANAAALANDLDAPFVLSAKDRPSQSRLSLPVFETEPLDFDDRRALWDHALLFNAISANDLDRLAFEFRLNAHEISEIAEAAHTISDMRTQARRRCRGDLQGLARRRYPRTDWDDLALRPSQVAALKAIAQRVRMQAQVCQNWGYGRRTNRGSGVTAMFAGPSGTGKTLAADVLATELDLDVLHVDLSQIVSKWIGETEKNLDRVFALAERGGALLLFDEADALFGKRSEVKDGRDRYANMEVSYLLQRMEQFAGLAILTTNQQSALDDAFLRRISVVVQFPFPDAETRCGIWQAVHPYDAPVEEMDAGRLAQIVAAGGDIRNIAMTAAYGAAGRGTEATITMQDILEAADLELAKLNRTRSGRGPAR